MRKTVLLLALAAANSAFADDTVFVSTATLDLGSDARDALVADVNGDGRPDLVSISDNVDSLNVILNEGPDEDERINFSDRRVFHVGEQPRGLAAGDYNGDGHVDLAVSDYEEDNIRVFEGDGTGDFTLAHTLSTGKNPTRMLFADVNGDGLDDLLALEYGPDRLAVFLATDNAFEARRTVSVTARPLSLAVDDIDGDGHLDVAVGGNNITILINDGNGTLSSRQTLSLSGNINALALGDVSGDGLADLLYARTNSGALRTVFNSGESRPYTDDDPVDSAYVKETNIGFPPAGFILQDVTGDASLDIVARSSLDAGMRVFEGTGYGLFVGSGGYTLRNAPLDHGGLGDFDGDGRLDIVVVTQASAVAEFLRGLNELHYDRFTTFSVGTTPVEVKRARLDGDADDDAIVRDSSQPVLYLLSSDGKGELVLQSTLALTAAAASFEVRDVNDDGLDDVFVNENGATSIRLFQSIGSGTLTHAETIEVGALIGDFVVGAFDGDATVDLAVIVPGANAVRIYSGLDWVTPVTEIVHGERPTRLAAGDVNGDGVEELLVVSGIGNTSFTIYDSAGTEIAALDLDGTVSDAQLVDIDGDGDADLAALSETHSTFVTWINDGAGSFGETPVEYEVERGPVAFQTDDVDGDGDLDVVVLAAYARRIEVLYREGEVYLTHGNSLTASSSPSNGAILDINADGRNELLVTLPSEGKLGLAIQVENEKPVARDIHLEMDHDEDEIESFLAGSDPNGDDLVYTIVRQPEHGSVELIDPSRGYIRYVPDDGFDERDSFTYVVDDGELASDVATASVYREDRKGGGGATWFLTALLGLVSVRRMLRRGAVS